MTYIASQLISSQEKAQLQNTFLLIDSNGDGRLSTDELVAGFKMLFGASYPAEEEVAKIMANLDIDNNGYIDYTEFVLSTLTKSELLTRERLVQAFAVFDKVRKD